MQGLRFETLEPRCVLHNVADEATFLIGQGFLVFVTVALKLARMELR